jgi:CubicO group peptidase (beta-lactamase class C family)
MNVPQKQVNFTFSIVFFLLTHGSLHAQLHLDTSAYLKNNPGIYSIVVAKNDRVIYKNYYNHYSEDSLFNDQSLTKSIGSLLIGIAIDKGYIRSVDEKAADFFPELKADSDKRKQEITIRQIMNQASGLYHENLEQLSVFLSLPDPSAFVVKAPLVADPGKEFHYNNAATHLLSVILTKSTGMDTWSFAKKFLFNPLGIKQFEWMKMRDGYYDGCGLLSVRLRSEDMVKVGMLLLNKGVYEHRQIVPAQWVASLFQPDISYSTEWGFDRSTYALCYYHTVYEGVPLTYGMGWGGQFLILIPSLNAIVVTNENSADVHAIQQSIVFMHRIFPLIFEQLLSLP